MDDLRPGPDRDAVLLARLRAGDAGAFEVIVREHRMAVYDLARRYTRDHAAADDAAQETFVRAWRALSRFRGDSSLRTWLFRIAINVLRSSRSRASDAQPLDAASEAASESESAASRLLRSEDARRLRAAVAALAPRQREVVLLKAFSDLTYDEVAGILGLTSGAVKAHFHQAVQNLRRRLAVVGEAR